MPKKADPDRAELHRKLDIILTMGCPQITRTVRFVMNSSYKLAQKKARRTGKNNA